MILRLGMAIGALLRAARVFSIVNSMANLVEHGVCIALGFEHNQRNEAAGMAT